MQHWGGASPRVSEPTHNQLLTSWVPREFCVCVYLRLSNKRTSKFFNLQILPSWHFPFSSLHTLIFNPLRGGRVLSPRQKSKHFLWARLGTKPWRGTYLIQKLLAWRTKFIQHLGSFRYFTYIIAFNLHSHPLGLIMVILILHMRKRRLSDDRQLAEGHLASTLPFLLSSLTLILAQMATRTILVASE